MVTKEETITRLLQSNRISYRKPAQTWGIRRGSASSAQNWQIFTEFYIYVAISAVSVADSECADLSAQN